MRTGLLLIPAIAAATPLEAQVQPLSGPGDPRLQMVDYGADQIVQLRSSPGYQLMLELSADEAIQSVAIGDGAAWQASVNKEGNRLFLKPIQPDAATNMTVVTSVRTYNFDLAASPAPWPQMPYTVRFRYPATVAHAADAGFVDVSVASRKLSRYRISGDSRLRPSSVSSDGSRTYITWPRHAAIPAIYAPDRHGQEALVNGMMGVDDTYVVDGTPTSLTFRIDRSVAHAKLLPPKRKR